MKHEYSCKILYLSDKMAVQYYRKYQKVSEYDQELPQSHTADLPTAPWGRAIENISSNNTYVRQ